MSSMDTPPTYTQDPPATTTSGRPVYPTQSTPVQKSAVRDRSVVRQPTGPSAHDRLSELIVLAILVVDLFLALDFVFRAVLASRDGFVQIVLRVGDALAGPFAGIFTNTNAAGHATFWAALIALAVYTVAALILLRIIHLVTSPIRRHATSS